MTPGTTTPRTPAPDTMTTYRRAQHHRRLRTVTLTALAAAAGAVLVAAVGWVDLWHAGMVASVIVAAVALVTSTAERVDDPTWPRRVEEVRAGGRHDVSDLGWSTFGRDGRVTDRVVDRVRTLAVTRLRVLGVDPSDPAEQDEVERLLGPGVVAGLTSGTPPTARTLQTWLDAIDRLATTAPQGIPQQSDPQGRDQRGTPA